VASCSHTARGERKRQPPLLGVMPPGKQLLRSQVVPPSNFGNDDARLHTLRHDLALPLSRPFPPPKLAIDHLEPTDLMNLSVTSTVKSRHLMIPKRITRKANQTTIMKVPAEQRLRKFTWLLCQFSKVEIKAWQHEARSTSSLIGAFSQLWETKSVQRNVSAVKYFTDATLKTKHFPSEIGATCHSLPTFRRTRATNLEASQLSTFEEASV